MGAQFIFKGLQRSIQEIKSTEGINICWVEEAQSISESSWEVLIPTIRAEDSEIWISFNPQQEEDPTFQRFVVNTPPNSIIHKVGWQENPFFPNVLDVERRYMLSIDPEGYQHVWEGDCRKISDAVIFKGHFEVGTFDEPPEGTQFYYGSDWGFSQDPTTLVRSFVRNNCLYISDEAYGIGVELDDLPELFKTVPGAENWPIKADNARPETISHMRRKGFNIKGADKWKGSVEDGIAVLKGYEKIIIHERCKHAIEEFRLYSYKVDKQTGDILPIIVDKHNHCIAEGALVTTIAGDIPIENIKIGDLVLTRAGYKKVLFAGPVGYDRPIVEVKTEDRSIKCTPDHRLFLEKKGFTFADALRYNDSILTLKKEESCPKQWNIKESFIQDIPIAKEVNIENISNDLALIKFLSDYIFLYGKNIMAPFLKDITFTTKIMIQRIMILQILNVLLQNNTHQNMNGQMTGKERIKSCSKGSGLLQKNGMLVRKEEKNIEKLGLKHIKTLNQFQKNANVAMLDFLLKKMAILIYFARINVNQHGVEHREKTMYQKNVFFAEKCLSQINIKKPTIVPDRVRSVHSAGNAKVVYDLTVEDQHEFFANGFLVHNCIDGIRYSLVGVIRQSNFFDNCSFKDHPGN